jgi:SNF2 family DNA or RNA helicase
MPSVHKDLLPYQRQGVVFLYKNKHAILADDMGLGKSAQSIAACDALDLKNILVICPGIARWNWVNEFKLWSVQGRRIQAIESSKQRVWADVVVISYSLLRSLKSLTQLLKRRWDVAIVDESHMVKSSEAWRSKSLYGSNFDAKNGIASVSERVWLLSGTLMPNNAGELWTHCHALFPDVAKGMGFARWREEYCRIIPGTDRVVGSKNQKQLAELLRPHVLRRLSRDVLPELPALRYTHIPVHPGALPPMSSEVSETAAVVRAALATMESAGGLTKGRLMLAEIDQGQMASLRRWTGIAKAPAVTEYIKNDFASGMDTIVVFAWHRDVITFLTDNLPAAASLHGGLTPKKKEAILTEFTKGSTIKTLVCNMEVASTAVNMVNSCNVAFAEPSWVPKDLSQAIARLHRQGQKRPVLARLFSLQGSFDETIMAVLTRKLKDTERFNQSIATRQQP